ncbi:MAG: DoxX family protein [Candidatus Parcubacteria bacterium]|nr:DoxX family protein [Candidatus Parcubacteria bacterium]
MTKTQKRIYYVLLVLISALFLFAAYSKLIEDPMQVAGFVAAGLPIWFMKMIGIGEILGVVFLWTKRFFRYGYEGLGLVLIGAFYTTWMFMSIPMAFTVVVPAAILTAVVQLHKRGAASSNIASAK